MRALVVLNPISGPRRGRSIDESRTLALAVLGRYGIDTQVEVTTARGDARAFATRAREDGVDLIVAWGGDGTINEVASAAAFSSSRLAVVPGGSGNGLARELGVPLDAAEALEVAASGRVRVIDAGLIDDNLFFNVAGIGLDAEIARYIAAPDARRGFGGYVKTTLGTLWRYRAEPYVITWRGGAFDGRALFVAVANSRQYGHGALIAPAARLDDGKLDLVIVGDLPLWRVLIRVPELFRGTIGAVDGVQTRQVREATLECEGPICYHVDGEPYLGSERIRIRIRHEALRVVVP